MFLKFCSLFKIDHVLKKLFKLCLQFSINVQKNKKMFKISNVVNALRNVSCFSKVANLFKNCSQFSINDLKLKKIKIPKFTFSNIVRNFKNCSEF